VNESCDGEEHDAEVRILQDILDSLYLDHALVIGNVCALDQEAYGTHEPCHLEDYDRPSFGFNLDKASIYVSFEDDGSAYDHRYRLDYL